MAETGAAAAGAAGQTVGPVVETADSAGIGGYLGETQSAWDTGTPAGSAPIAT